MKLQNILIIISFLFFSISLSAQTCSDGMQNGTETGIDCGGSCPTGSNEACLTDDVYVRNGNSSVNNGQLRIRGGSNKHVIYLKFNIAGVSGSITSAKLRMSVNDNTYPNARIYKSSSTLNNTNNDPWSEETAFSYNIRPQYSTATDLLSSSGSLVMGSTSRVEWTLTASEIPTSGVFTIAVESTSSNTVTIFGSKENSPNISDDIPELIIVSDGSGGGGGGNNPPTVSFVSPTDGQSFAAGTDLPVEASASDDDTVTGVEFFYDNASQGTDNTAPYQWTVSNLAQGPHMLKVVATDNDGATSEEEISIMVNAGGGGSGAWQSGASGAIYYNSGNVGIGVASPSQPLHVAGEIYASRVRVKTEAGGADFVFEEDYGLMPLEEVEAYVKKHKHLPEIPSEQEMMENDLQLGDFSIKLLQKVEELTLYLIELKKENEVLKRENQEIKKEIEALKQK